MFSGIAFALTWIFDQLVTPFKWFAALPFYDWQLPIMVVAFILLFYQPLSVSSMAVIDAIEEGIKDWFFHRKWNALARQSDHEFAQFIAALEASAEEKEQTAERYDSKALANRFRYMPGSRRNLLRTADKHRDRAEQIREHITEHKRLRAEVVARRDQLGGMGQLLGIIDRLNSSDPREALEALQALNGMRNVDWSAAIATRLPPRAQGIVIKCLHTMTGTTNLHEARNAYAQVAKILMNHRMSWEDMAA